MLWRSESEENLTIVVLTIAATKSAIALAVVTVGPGNAHTMRHAGLVLTAVLRVTCEHAPSYFSTTQNSYTHSMSTNTCYRTSTYLNSSFSHHLMFLCQKNGFIYQRIKEDAGKYYIN